MVYDGRKEPHETEFHGMTNTTDEINQLKHEVAELSGLALATGVLLTQLLQANLKRELNPWNSATKMMAEARTAIEGFPAETDGERDPAMKQRALEALKQYETQIRSVLPT
jgi:hypothetical protein